MKVYRGIDVSHVGGFKINLKILGKGDNTIVAEFFPVHPAGMTLTTLINEGVSTSSGITRKYLSFSS